MSSDSTEFFHGRGVHADFALRLLLPLGDCLANERWVKRGKTEPYYIPAKLKLFSFLVDAETVREKFKIANSGSEREDGGLSAWYLRHANKLSNRWS